MRAAVVAFLLAGCLGAPAAPVEPASGGTLRWGIEDCAFVIVAVPVDEAALAALLPEGFRLRASALATLPAGPRATLELDAYRCTRGRWGNATSEDLSYGSFYAAVEPPEALREDGYEAYFVKWDPLVQDADARASMLAAGLRAHEGEAVVGGTGSSVTASLTLDDGSGFSLTGVVGVGDGTGDPLPFMEFTPLEGGDLARWHARLHDAIIYPGTGVVELSPGWVRDLVGEDRAPATFIAGTWNLDEADVGWAR